MPEASRARPFMSLYALLWLYRRRLRAHRVQELLAGIGVTIAVALVFATIVAAGSIAGSAGEVAAVVAGPASLQMHARGPYGLPERLLAQVERQQGVSAAAPLLEQTATIVAPSGRHVSVDLAGANLSLVTLDGLAHTLPRSTLDPNGISLSLAAAKQLGLTGSKVLLQLDGRPIERSVSTVLGVRAFRALAQATVAVMPLEELQRLSAMQRRVTRILVATKPGRRALVAGELRRLGGSRVEVAPAEQDVTLLREALRPSDQASAFFASVSSLLGLLLAFNALLLTVPERRRAIADLRLLGVRRTAIAQMLLFQALLLGTLACIAGLGCGYLLSVNVLRQSPRYLDEAFTLGSRTIVSLAPVLLAIGAGLIASCLACAVPLLDLRRGRAIDAVRNGRDPAGGASHLQSRRVLAACCAALLVAASAIFAFAPALALLACVLLAGTATLAVPLTLAAVMRAANGPAESRPRLTILPVALSSLRGTTLRSFALAGTGAVALFGSIALGGAQADLTRGIDRFSASYSSDAGIWVGNPSDYQSVVPFEAGEISRQIAGLPGVSAVQRFQGGFMQLAGRRVWVLARPAGGAQHLLASQLLDGNPAAVARKLDRGGWIVVSKQIAQVLGASVGTAIALPTPSGPRRMRIAATTTNLAWSPGSILISSAEYQRLWQTSMPTALAVKLRDGASTTTVLKDVKRLLPPGGALQASTARQRQTSIEALASEGLGQLSAISTLLLIAAILAMAAALISTVWQRRTALADLRLWGVRPARLRAILLVEAALMLGAGCLTGALAGLYGQVVIDAYLERVTGFPVADLSTATAPLQTFALAAVAVLMLTAVPGWLASCVSPAAAFGE